MVAATGPARSPAGATVLPYRFAFPPALPDGRTPKMKRFDTVAALALAALVGLPAGASDSTLVQEVITELNERHTVAGTDGAKSYRILFDAYLQRGYRVFAIRHGSSPRYGIPDAVSDVRRAVRFIRQEASRFEIDPDRMAVMGMSAGGHLALMIGTTGDEGQPD